MTNALTILETTLNYCWFINILFCVLFTVFHFHLIHNDWTKMTN